MRAALMLMLFLAGPLAAQEAKPVRSHGLTILGAPALPAGFPHFPYVNPAAPKGGEVAFAMTGSFDGFNPYILRGNPAFGTGAAWQPGVGGAGVRTALRFVSGAELAGAFRAADLVVLPYREIDQSGVLFTALAFGKPLLSMVFDSVFHLTEEGWRKLTVRWALFFFALAILNEIVWRTQTTDVWVSFKVFGVVPLTFLFGALQYPLLTKYAAPETKEAGE